MSLEQLVNPIVQLVVAGLVVWLLLWFVSWCALPEPFAKITKVIIGLAAVVFLIKLLSQYF